MVTVFTKPGCVQCTATYRRLNARGIEFEVRDVSVDDAAMATVRDLGYQQVPVVMTGGGEHWGGYNPDKLDALR